MDKRVAKRLRTLEGLVRVQLALIIALIIGLCAALTTIHTEMKNNESNINTVETVNQN